MRIQAFAKINWSLDITGTREDGYHFMDMLMQPVSVSDEIFLDPSPNITISVSGSPLIRADRTNLAFRAAAALSEATGCSQGIHIHLEKRIPSGAGMGGGSADAAAVLIGANHLWKTGLSASRLEQIGLRLGADVPFFIRGGLTRTRGIGELLEAHDSKTNYRLIVVQPCPGLSTAQVFARWKQAEVQDKPDTDRALQALETGDLELLCRSIGNVLQPVSEELRGEIRQACTELTEQGALVARMTGSGSAVFGVFRSGPVAAKAFSNLTRMYKTAFLCHTQHDSIRIIEE